MTKPHDSLTRVYTDSRFEGLQLVNEGTPVMTVMACADGGRTAHIIETVRTRPTTSGTLSESDAAAFAALFFEDLAEDYALDARRRHTPAVLTSDKVLDMWERAAAMPPGPEKEELLKQVLAAANQVESAAQSVVSRILGD